jgi:hypothetical protein
VTAARGTPGDGTIGSRADIENPGAIFTDPAKMALYAHRLADPMSISQNIEYDWGYYFDNKSHLLGFTDPYVTGPAGGDKINIILTSNGISLSSKDVSLVGMAHTHGDYSTHDAHGNIVRATKFTDAFKSDDFSPDDLTFMYANKYHWQIYTLGTPSGNDLMYTPKGGVQPLP